MLLTDVETASRQRPNSASKIAEHLRVRILKRQLEPGQKLGTEIELAREFKVCSATIQKSLKELERDGLIWAKRGVGRFVSDAASRPKTGVLAVVLLDTGHLFHPVMSQMMAGVAEVARASIYHLKIYALHAGRSSQAAHDGQGRWLELIKPEDVDGVLIATQVIDLRMIQWLAERVPVVCPHAPLVHENLSIVGPDMLGGAYQIGRHLLEQGHRRIALLTTPESDPFGRDQREGLRLAAWDLVRAKQCEVRCLDAEDFVIEEGRRLGREIVADPQRPTAIICGSDELAQGVYGALNEAGLRVPEDISMTAWNDTLTLDQVPVAMTTVNARWEQVGMAGAQRLLQMIRNPQARMPMERIDYELVVRDSTRPITSPPSSQVLR